MPTHPALSLLHEVGRTYPTAWQGIESFRADRASLGDWPETVYCPLAGAYAIVSGGGNQRVPLNIADHVALIGALAAWRPTQGIYRFDPDLYDALIRSPVTGVLPCELLQRLPAWCVYIELPYYESHVLSPTGVFIHLEYDPNHARLELRLLLTTTTGHLIPIPLHLGAWPLNEAITRYLSAAMDGAEPGTRQFAQNPEASAVISDIANPCLSLALYLCSEAADYQRPPPLTPKQTRRRGTRLFLPDGPTTWDVGLRIGAALRLAREAAAHNVPETPVPGTHASPRPHIRAAHWHLFWKGPRDGERTPLVRWIPPTGVRMSLGDDAPAVIRTVKPAG